jgi:ubiquinone/menaquinone biosynthesis C-methylase UbiE
MREGFRQLFLGDDHVCPWWFAYTFDNPVRRLMHKPERLFDGLVREGQTVVDIGCGMGHFSLGLARIVGEAGRVIAVDLQSEMLWRVRQRAARAGLLDRIELWQANAEQIGIGEQVDFVLAFWMVHEVPDKPAFFVEVKRLLKPEAHLLMAEPKVHVTRMAFEREVAQARATGLKLAAEPPVAASWAALFALSDKTA